MAKRNHNVDFITDIQERANHNINPYHWFNHVTPFTMAQWRTNKYFAPLFFVLYSAMGGLLLISFLEDATRANQTFWAFLFDFRDSFTSARCTGFLVFVLLWVAFAFSTIQSVLQGIYASMLPKQKRRRERKKKYSKRPKNYK